MAANRAPSADGCPWKEARRRSPRDQRHTPCAQKRLSVERLPARIWSLHDSLQPLHAVGSAWGVGATVPKALRSWTSDRHADDRFHSHQSASLGIGRKKGEHKQAIGRSRGGRNTKIHAITDAKGRLLSFLLTGGDAHDCPPAERLIRRTKIARKLLADKAYDSAPLRQWLQDRGTTPVIPNRSNRKQPFRFQRQTYKKRHRVENAICRLKDFRRIATRYDRLARNYMASVCLVAVIAWWIL